MAKSVVGLDIGSSVIRAVQVKPVKNSFKFEKIAEVPLEHGIISQSLIIDQEKLSATLKELWKIGRFTTNIVRLGIGDELSSISRVAEIDWLEDASFSKILPHIVAEKLFIEKDDYSIDYHTLSEYMKKEVEENNDIDEDEDEELYNSQTPENLRNYKLVPKKYILIAGGKNEIINSLVSSVRKANLKPISIDLNALAIIRVHQPTIVNTKAVDVSINIGAEVITIILHKSGQPLYLRDVAGIAGNRLTNLIKEELKVSFSKAEYRKFEVLYSDIAVKDQQSEFTSFFSSDSAKEEEAVIDNGEVNKLKRKEKIQPLISQSVTEIIHAIRETLDAFFSNEMGMELPEISGFSMSGGVSNMPGLLERISAEFQVDVRRATPLTPMLTPKMIKNIKPEILMLENTFSIATGLAIGTGASHA